MIPFLDQAGQRMGTVIGEGLDGRLYTDLAALTPGTRIVGNDRFYVRTRYPDRIDPSTPWKVTLSGHVREPIVLGTDDIHAMAQPIGDVLLECAGNSRYGGFGLMSAATWDGVPIGRILALARPTAAATQVLISGFDEHSAPSARSTPGASWVFPIAQLERAGAFLATRMNGEALSRDHGFPLRLVVPRWYACTHIKWVDELRFVDDREPATAQMKEYAARTHQTRAHARARDYAPAVIDRAAMPVRVEQWRVDGRIQYRVIGVTWGGGRSAAALAIRFGDDGPYRRLSACPGRGAGDTWSWWEHVWTPRGPGRYQIQIVSTDRSIPTRRLDRGYYRRAVDIERRPGV